MITTRLDARHLHEQRSTVIIEQPHTSTFQTINLYPQCIPANAAGEQTVVAFNCWHQPRYLCGNRIEPNSYLTVKEPCHEGIRVFPEEPGALNDINVPPIDLILRSQTTVGLKATKHNCPVPCQEWGEGSNAQTIFVGGTDFKFHQSMESTATYSALRIDPDAWRKNLFYSTTSFRSEIPLPYFSWTDYDIQKPAVQYSSVIKGASFIASNCASHNSRESVVQELMTMMRVDSLGTCIPNAEPPPGSSRNNKESMLQKYLFHLAFENSNEEDYITEKLWGTLASGTLPVYMGAPNVQDHVPDHSIISWHDFPSTQKLGEYLQKVAADKELYESYHTWRTKALPEKFQRKYDMTRVHSVCRTCKFVYAKMRGLGWNRETQEIQDLSMPRKLCLNQKGIITYPFVEKTSSVGEAPGLRAISSASTKNCNPTGAHSPTRAMVGAWQRIVWFHDGVIDISLEGLSDDAYRIKTYFATQFTSGSRPNVYQVQNDDIRMTIVGNPQLRISLGKRGTLDIRTSQKTDSTEPMRIRVIMEEVDKFHAGAESVQNHYGAFMIEEFDHPLQCSKIGHDGTKGVSK